MKWRQLFYSISAKAGHVPSGISRRIHVGSNDTWAGMPMKNISRKCCRIFLLISIAGLFVSCSDNSSGSSGTDDDPPSFDSGPLYGTWAGFFKAGDEDKLIPTPGADYDDIYGPGEFDQDPNDLFVIGIIDKGTTNSTTSLQKAEALFISDTSLFHSSGSEDYLWIQDQFSLPGITKVYYGYFSYYSWADTTGLDYSATVDDISIFGETSPLLSNSLLSGLYWKTGVEEYWETQLTLYTTTGVTTDLSKVTGTWKISHACQNDNTLTFTINANGTISGGDSGAEMHNTFTGTIQILYSDTRMYRVNLTMNPGVDGVDLEGLATYIESMHYGGEDGIRIEKVLALGATGSGHFIKGFAKKQPE